MQPNYKTLKFNRKYNKRLNKIENILYTNYADFIQIKV